MKNKFDELAMGLAQTTTRRQALKKFGIGLAGMALACFGLVSIAEAAKTCLPSGAPCVLHRNGRDNKCCSGVCLETPTGDGSTFIGFYCQ